MFLYVRPDLSSCMRRGIHSIPSRVLQLSSFQAYRIQRGHRHRGNRRQRQRIRHRQDQDTALTFLSVRQ